MKHIKEFLQPIDTSAQRGGMLVELMLSVALAAVIIPFVFRYQQNAVTRAENIALTQQMELIQASLERYIMYNQDALLTPVGKNITRVNLTDLVDYGVPHDMVNSQGARYQLRVLKSASNSAQPTLQGIIVFTDADISPKRTREIINLGGDNMGFVEDNRAYGAFGTWRTDAVDLGINANGGIVDLTPRMRADTKYLWRLPSENAADATMKSSLNLGGHDVTNAKFFDASAVQFDEVLAADTIVADTVLFQNRTTIDRQFETQTAVVAGSLSSDSRSMEIANTFTLNDLWKFSSFTTDDLWVTNLTLGGMSVRTDMGPSILKINQNLDMTAGRIDAVFASVAFAGSITPRLFVRNLIEDSINPDYYWDAYRGAANLRDVTFMELGQMATTIAARERVAGTAATELFGATAANKNATAADFMNAISEIQRRVRIKYRQLNLE